MGIHKRTAVGKVVVPQRHRPLIMARFLTAYRVLEMYFLLKRAVYNVEEALISTPVWTKKSMDCSERITNDYRMLFVTNNLYFSLSKTVVDATTLQTLFSS